MQVRLVETHLVPHLRSWADESRLLASHYMVAIAYHVTLKGSQVGQENFFSVLAARLLAAERHFQGFPRGCFLEVLDLST